MRIFKILFFLVIFSLTLGQLARFSIGETGGSVNLIDLFVATTFFSWLLFIVLKRRKIFLPLGFLPLFIFWFVALISLVNSFKFFNPKEVLTGSLFLLRFIFYSSMYIVVYNVFKKKDIHFLTNLLIYASLVIAFLGILQLIFIPDLRFLNVYGWDPHIRRLVSTFLDPNYVGGFLTLGFILVVSKMVFDKEIKKPDLFAVLFLLISIILTFSRSSYLMLLTGIFLIGILKSRKIFLLLLIIFVVFVAFVPKARERIIGGITFDITAQARIESWQNALTVAEEHPFLGVGFNNFRFAQKDFGFFNYPLTEDIHSGAGSDSSLLTILATCGVLGFGFFVFIYIRILIRSFLLRKNYLAFCTFVSISAIFVHSQFVNSLLFPPVMVWLWIISGLSFMSLKDER